MTLTIELTPEEEQRIQRAQAIGIDVSALMKGVIAALPAPLVQEATEPHSAEEGTEPTWGARVLARWEREGLLGPFGDPNLDSPELARQLRRQAETREHEA